VVARRAQPMRHARRGVLCMFVSVVIIFPRSGIVDRQGRDHAIIAVCELCARAAIAKKLNSANEIFAGRTGTRRPGPARARMPACPHANAP